MNRKWLYLTGLLASIGGLLTLFLHRFLDDVFWTVPWEIPDPVYGEDVGGILSGIQEWIVGITDFVPMLLAALFIISALIFLTFIVRRRAISIDKERQHWYAAICSFIIAMISIRFLSNTQMESLMDLFVVDHLGVWMIFAFGVVIFLSSCVLIGKARSE
ncbi:MAG: hypothetical protein FWD92_01585 [Methanomassiliicoccaceae archaeon]|nr:hypothetical protein [Methanomassiliicoccaceae archaeon]